MKLRVVGEELTFAATVVQGTAAATVDLGEELEVEDVFGRPVPLAVLHHHRLHGVGVVPQELVVAQVALSVHGGDVAADAAVQGLAERVVEVGEAQHAHLGL